MSNILLCTDVYKMGHMEQYPRGTTKIYSHLLARSDKEFPATLFYGLQPLLKRFEVPLESWMADEFLELRQSILGTSSHDVEHKVRSLVDLGYIPLLIKAVPEGTVVPVRNVLMTVTNTHPDFAWVVGFFESYLLKVWSTCTVATYSRKLRLLCEKYARYTCEDDSHVPFQVHDFGYRGCSSEETAASAGSAHLVNFVGTDTLPAIKFVHENYGVPHGAAGLSVPASEHSVMCAFGREFEYEAFENMLDLYPNGIVSIVSDTYDLWNVITDFLPRLKPRIVARDGKVVIRPDSGDPVKIICGDDDAPLESPQRMGVLELLGREFGWTMNRYGFKVLNPKIGLIYGDGFYYKRFEEVLERMSKEGWASSNLVVGMGGLLLQQWSRDTQGFAIKATYAEVDGQGRELMKDPVTDPGKKSHKGLMCLYKNPVTGLWKTTDCASIKDESEGFLRRVFENGQTYHWTFDEVREKARE